MNSFVRYTLAPLTSEKSMQLAWLFLRLSMGILTIFHGIPKMSGIDTWHNLGVTFMYPLGIKFLPTMWGFLGAITEFFGGIFLTLGLTTRISSIALTIMMIIATSWHISQGDGFIKYSFPLTLIFVYLAFLFIGGGKMSLDRLLTKKEK